MLVNENLIPFMTCSLALELQTRDKKDLPTMTLGLFSARPGTSRLDSERLEWPNKYAYFVRAH
jgi:hypothetical protein